MVLLFFFQAEDGIRYLTVTGVQTCALPISAARALSRRRPPLRPRSRGPRGRPWLSGRGSARRRRSARSSRSYQTPHRRRRSVTAGDGQPDTHGGAVTDPTGDLQAAAGFLDVALRDSEAEACALGPGGEERLAQVGQDFRGNPRSRIGDFERDAVGATVTDLRLRRDLEPPTVRHGVQRVGDDLGQRLLEPHGIDPDFTERRRDGHPQLDSVLAQQLGETGERAVDQRLHALQQRAERSGARKGQQVRDPLVETIYLFDDGVQLFAGGAGRALDAALSELRGGSQARERVPPPVGPARRPLARKPPAR